MAALRKLNAPAAGGSVSRLAERDYQTRERPEHDVCFDVEAPAGATPGWLVRDCGAQGFDVGLDVRNAQSGEIHHYASTACRIGERIAPYAPQGRPSSITHSHCRYVQADIGILLQDSGPYQFGDHTWTHTQFHQNRVCAAAMSASGRNIDATFVDGESEYDAQDDMAEARDSVRRALWHWNAGGRLTIRDWNCRDARVTDHVVLEGPASLTLDGYNGGGNSKAYVVRKIHPRARVEWYGRVAVLGKAQGVARWPDGYSIVGDMYSASSIDGHPSEDVRSGFPNLARQRTLELNLDTGQAVVESWSIYGAEYIAWIWPGVAEGPLFIGFMIVNLESYSVSIAIDMGHGPHEVHLGPNEVKRYAYYTPGAFHEHGAVMLGAGRVRLYGIQVLWGPPSLELHGRIDECLRLGTRSA